MLRFARAKPLVGLDIGSSAVKVVELRRFKGGYELSRAGLQPLAAGTVVDGVIADARSLADSIQEIFSRHTIKNKNVATSVAGHAVIVKKISLPAMSREELDESIQWEAEQHVPFDAADVNLDYQVLEGASGSGEAEVLLVAAKKDKILSHTEVIAQAGRSPLVVDVDAFALQNAYQSNYRPASSMTAALLNIGANIMNVVVTRGGIPLFTRDVSVGGNQFTGLLQKELDLSFEEAEQVKRENSIEGVDAGHVSSLLESVSEVLLLEIRKSIDFFEATSVGERIQRVYVSGGCSNVTGFMDLLQRKLDLPLEPLDPFKSIRVGKGVNEEKLYQEAPSLAVAVGLALRSFDD